MPITLEFVFPGDGYDPETCITVGELRKIGTVFDPKVPDVAWMKRSDMRVLGIKTAPDGPNRIKASIEMSAGSVTWQRILFETESTVEEVRESLTAGEVREVDPVMVRTCVCGGTDWDPHVLFGDIEPSGFVCRNCGRPIDLAEFKPER